MDDWRVGIKTENLSELKETEPSAYTIQQSGNSEETYELKTLLTNVRSEELGKLVEHPRINGVKGNTRNGKKRTKRNGIEEETIMGIVNNINGG